MGSLREEPTMIRHRRSLIFLLLLTWPLAAAGQPAITPPRTVDGVAIDPDAELVVALADDTTNMDPRIGMGSIRSNYIRQVFESLVDVDAQGRPAPGLALAWKPVGELTWEFALRRGVAFHDGEPFNADTVLFNLDRFFRRNLDKWGLKDVLAATQFEKTYPFVSRWERVDDYTVRIHTSEPAPTLWDFIGREPMVPKAYTVKNGVEGLNDRPVGTGPWKMVEWKRKTSMLFEKNDATGARRRSFARCASRRSPRAPPASLRCERARSGSSRACRRSTRRRSGRTRGSRWPRARRSSRAGSTSTAARRTSSTRAARTASSSTSACGWR